MMAAALAEGTTVLRNAAREPRCVASRGAQPHGADISGAGTPEITIHGVGSLRRSPPRYHSGPDRDGDLHDRGGAHGGHVTIAGCEPQHVGATMDKLRQAGALVGVEGRTITVTGPERIASVDIQTQPFPGFATDMQAQFMVLIERAEGVSIISETILKTASFT